MIIIRVVIISGFTGRTELPTEPIHLSKKYLQSICKYIQFTKHSERLEHSKRQTYLGAAFSLVLNVKCTSWNRTRDHAFKGSDAFNVRQKTFTWRPWAAGTRAVERRFGSSSTHWSNDQDWEGHLGGVDRDLRKNPPTRIQGTDTPVSRQWHKKPI